MNIDQYIGRLLDERYEILEVIGTGGMAVVYKARCHRLNRLVAIKILKDEYARDEEFRRRFHAEGEAVAMLSHPNIVQVYDVSSTETANFIVMELIDGISMKQYMEKKGVLNWKETLHFSMQIAKGLEHAHSRGIVHRDIKPHNVMVLKNGSVKVMDFGIARVMNKSNTLTKEALGSVHYISPEQAKGGYTDNRSDLYSLSVVMYEMMTGRPPYDGESAVAVAIQHINGGAAMPATLNPNIPGGLEQIIMKGMALDVKDRYPSATEMLMDMEEFRKNPAILFGYVYRTPMDDATRPITVIQAPPPRTTAERVAQSKSGQARPTRQSTGNMNRNSGNMNRTTGNMNRGTGNMNRATGNMNRGTGNMNATGNMNRTRDPEAIRRAQQRRKEEEARKREEERNHIATVAVVICSAVAVVAIIVFLVALFNGALLNQEKEYAIVPNLVGKEYHEDFDEMYSNFKIVLRPQEYSDEYNKGQIINQEPAKDSKVFKGTELYITISMGKEPAVKVMENLIGVPIENAQSYMDGQKLETLIHMEASEEFAEGLVIRTDPAAGVTLKENPIIHIYVSAGPETVEMPQVVGMDKNTALGRLNSIRLVNVVTMDVESDRPKGQVVSQSIPKGEKIGLSTEIVLEISEGPVETTAEPTVESTEPESTSPKETASVENTVKVTFILPERENAYQLNIMLDENDVVEPQIIQPGVTSITLEFTGTGTEVYELFIDGVHYRSEKVIFTND